MTTFGDLTIGDRIHWNGAADNVATVVGVNLRTGTRTIEWQGTGALGTEPPGRTFRTELHWEHDCPVWLKGER